MSKNRNLYEEQQDGLQQPHPGPAVPPHPAAPQQGSFNQPWPPPGYEIRKRRSWPRRHWFLTFFVFRSPR